MSKALKVVGKIAGVAAVVLAFVPGGQPFAAAASAISGIANTASQLLAPPRPTGSVSQVIIDTDAPTPYVMGRTFAPGVLVHDAGYGADYKKIPNPNRTQVFVYSDCGPVNSIEGLYTDGQFAVSSGAASGYYGDDLYFDKLLGQTNESRALTGNRGSITRWGASHKLSSKASGAVTMRWDKKQKKWTAGVPKLGVLMEGVKVYSRRNDSTAPGGNGPCRANDEATYIYSANPSDHAVTYLLGRYVVRNGESIKIFGVGKSVDSIDFDAMVEWANVCDANNWVIGGTIYEPADKWNNLKLIMQAGGATPSHNNGQISVKFQSPKVAVVTLTENDLADGEVVVPATRSFRDRINSVIPRFRSAAHNWEYVPGSAVTFSNYLEADGELKRKEMQYSLVQNATHAAQLAAYEVSGLRELSDITLPMKPIMVDFGPGETVELDMPNVGLIGLFTITSRRYDPLSATFEVGFESETSTKHPFALGASTVLPEIPSLTFGPELNRVADAVSGYADLVQSLITSSWVEGLTMTGETPAASTVSSVTMTAHTRNYSDDATAVNGGVIEGLDPETVYYIYYDDVNRQGAELTNDAEPPEVVGVTYQATENINDAQNSEAHDGRHFVGYITTPAIGEANTSGYVATPPTLVPDNVPNADSVGLLTAQDIIDGLDSAIDQTALDAATSALEDADAQLQTNLEQVETSLESADAQLQTNLNQVEASLNNADAQLQGSIDAAQAANLTANAQLQSSINTVSLAASQADSLLQGAIDGAIATNSSQQVELNTLTVSQSDAISRIDSVEIVASDNATQITQLSTTTAGNSSSIANLNTTTANQATSLSQLTTQSLSNTSQISQLATTTAEQAQLITSLSSSSSAAVVAGQDPYITNPSISFPSVTQYYQTGVVGAPGGTTLRNGGRFQIFGNIKYYVEQGHSYEIKARVRLQSGTNTSRILIAGARRFADGTSAAVNSGIFYVASPVNTFGNDWVTISGIMPASALVTSTGEVDHFVPFVLFGLEDTSTADIWELGSYEVRDVTDELEATSRIDSVETVNASQATSISGLQTTAGANSSSITNLQSTTAAQATDLTNLSTTVDDHTSEITVLNTTTAAQASSLTSLSTTTANNTSSISQLLTTTADQASLVTSLSATATTAGLTPNGRFASELTAWFTLYGGATIGAQSYASHAEFAHDKSGVAILNCDGISRNMRSDFFEVDTSKTYRLYSEIRLSAATRVYTGIECYGENFLYLGGSRFRYWHSNELFPANEWVSGPDLTMTGSQFPAGTKFARAVTFVNIQSEPGVTAYFASLYLADVTEITDATSRIDIVENVTATNATSISGLETTAGANSSSISNLQSTTATQATALTNLSTVSGDNASDISTLFTTTASQATSLSTLSTTSGDNSSAISNLQSTTAHQATLITNVSTTAGANNSAISTLQSTTASQATTLSSLQTTDGQHTSSINSLNTTTANQASSLTTLSSTVGNHSSDLSNLNVVTNNQATAINNLSTTMNGNTSSINTLNTTTASHAQTLTEHQTDIDGQSSSISSLISTQQGQATSISNLNSQAGGFAASISNQSTAISNLETGAAAAISFRAVSGTSGAQLELAAFSNINGSASTARISADNIILDGTIQSAHIGALQVNTLNIGDNAVTVPKVLSQNITRNMAFRNNGGTARTWVMTHNHGTGSGKPVKIDVSLGFGVSSLGSVGGSSDNVTLAPIIVQIVNGQTNAVVAERVFGQYVLDGDNTANERFNTVDFGNSLPFIDENPSGWVQYVVYCWAERITSSSSITGFVPNVRDFFISTTEFKK